MSDDGWFERYKESRGRKIPKHFQDRLAGKTGKRLKERRVVPSDALRIGEHPDSARAAYFLPKELNTHLHMIGASGRGKSNLLRFLAKQILDRHDETGEGLGVIDPHGSLAQHVLALCAAKGEAFADRVVYLDLTEAHKIAVFNPLRREYGIERVALGFVEAMMKAEGSRAIMDTPLISEVLSKTVQALLHNGLSLAEAGFFVRHTEENEAVRRRLLESVTDKNLVDYWREIEKGRTWEQRAETIAAARRFDYVLQNPTVRRMVGQCEFGLDLRQIMDEGQILIVDLSGAKTDVPETALILLGALLLQEFRQVTRGRDADRSLPFYLIVDEFADFVSEDVMRVLTGTRKFGLRAVLSHQEMSQLMLPDGDDRLLKITLGVEQKVVFGGGMWQDKLLLAEQLFAEHLDLDKVKFETWQTKFWPHLRKVILESSSSIRSGGDIPSEGVGTTLDAEGNVISQSVHTSVARPSGEVEAKTWSESYLIMHEAFKELGGREYEAFADQVTRKAQALKAQPIGRCTVARAGEEPLSCEVPYVEDAAVSAEERQRFLERVYEKPFYLTPEEADRRIEERRQRLLAGTGRVIDVTPEERTFEPEDVWEQEEDA